MSRSPKHQRGAALIIVMLLSTLLLIMIATGAKISRNAYKDTTEVFRAQGQASNVAQAGLQDAIAWFKRHQPVKQSASDTCKDVAFNPVENADPTLSDTDDDSLGIVKDIQLNGSLYGRYIVKKQGCGTEDPHTVRDITAARGKSSSNPPLLNANNTIKGEGAVWYIESQGYVYLRNDYSKTNGVFTKGPNEAPNRLIRSASAAIEISRLTVNTDPVPLTVFSSTNTHSFSSACSMISGVGGSTADSAVYYAGGNPNTDPIKVTPTSLQKEKSRPLGAVTPESVFSVSATELRGMADNVYTAQAQVPSSLPRFAITYFEGDYVFTNAKPLVGGGLLFVNGNLTLSDGANSLFSGVVYVTGTLTMGRDNSLAGTVMARTVDCDPSSGNAQFEYNTNLVTTVRQRLALYRENNLTHTYREY